MSSHIIKDVDRYRVMDPLFEGVRVTLSHRGESYSPSYVQGISGAAFRIAGICPCAPTSNAAMETQDLVELLGYEMEYVPLHGEKIDLKKRANEVLSRLKGEIRVGHPVLLWHAFTTCEWDVVCGFDDEEGLLFGRGSYAGLDGYAKANEMRTISCLEICPALGAIFVSKKTGIYDAHNAEINALKEAVYHAHSKMNAELLVGDKWVMLEGLLCYDRWVRDFRSERPKIPDMGDRYCLGVYRSTHRAAADFLKELAPKYPDVKSNYESAAKFFVAESDALDECANLLFPDWKLPKNFDRETNVRAADILNRARDSYAGGIGEIGRALEVMKGQ